MKEIHTVRVYSRNRCPIGCKFCSSTNQLTWGSEANVPVISATEGTLVEVVDRIVKSHPRVRTVYLTDDDFCINKASVIRFCKQIIERNLTHISYMCFARITDLNEQLVSWLSQAGFRRLNIGVETFSQSVLNEYGKICDVEKIETNLAMLKQFNVEPYMNVILVSPNSKLEDVELTVDKAFCYIQDPFYRVGVTLAIKPLNGTEFREVTSDYKTQIDQIGSTRHYLQRHEMIYAFDPYVRQAQVCYYHGVDAEVGYWSARNDLVHLNSVNVSKIKLNFMKRCIDLVRARNGLPERTWKSGPTNNEGPGIGDDTKLETVATGFSRHSV